MKIEMSHKKKTRSLSRRLLFFLIVAVPASFFVPPHMSVLAMLVMAGLYYLELKYSESQAISRDAYHDLFNRQTEISKKLKKALDKETALVASMKKRIANLNDIANGNLEKRNSTTLADVRKLTGES